MVHDPFSDVRGSGFIFGRSGFGHWGGHFRTFGVRISFSDVRGWGFGVQWNMVYFRTFGFLMFGVQPRTSENQKHQKPRMSEKKTEPPTSETPNIRNPEPRTPKIRTPNVSNPECPSGVLYPQQRPCKNIHLGEEVESPIQC